MKMKLNLNNNRKSLDRAGWTSMTETGNLQAYKHKQCRTRVNGEIVPIIRDYYVRSRGMG